MKIARQRHQYLNAMSKSPLDIFPGKKHPPFVPLVSSLKHDSEGAAKRVGNLFNNYI